jgi:hypothetical protein
MKIFFFLLLLLAVAASAAAVEFTCKTADDCELLGSCESGICKCQPGWQGPTCGQLKLLPAPSHGAWPTNRPIPPKISSVSSVSSFEKKSNGGVLPNSWGGSFVTEKSAVDETTKYHIYVDTGCYDAATLLHEVSGSMEINLEKISGKNKTHKSIPSYLFVFFRVI